MALMPTGGDDARNTLASMCSICGERPGLGPCAFCHMTICGESTCSTVIEETGLEPVVLCSPCATSGRARWSDRRALILGMALAGVALLTLWVLGLLGQFSGLGLLGAATLLTLAGAFGALRVEWRSRLRRARRK